MAGLEDRTWVLVAAYSVVAIEALIASRISDEGRQRFFWGITSATLLFFAVAKQIQLQSRSSDWLRIVARNHHLYGSRALVQYLFLLILFVGVVILVRRLRDWARGSTKPIATAALAMTALVTFILVRAASVHALDAAMTMELGGLRSGWWVELAILLVIAIAAASFLHEQRPAIRR